MAKERGTRIAITRNGDRNERISFASDRKIAQVSTLQIFAIKSLLWRLKVFRGDYVRFLILNESWERKRRKSD